MIIHTKQIKMWFILTYWFLYYVSSHVCAIWWCQVEQHVPSGRMSQVLHPLRLLTTVYPSRPQYLHVSGWWTAATLVRQPRWPRNCTRRLYMFPSWPSESHECSSSYCMYLSFSISYTNTHTHSHALIHFSKSLCDQGFQW